VRVEGHRVWRLAVAAGVLGATLVAAGQAPTEDPRRQAIVDAQLAGDFPVDLDRGRQLFVVACGRCHVFGDLGSAFGPDLSTVRARFQESDLLEAILWPSRVVSDQYQAQRIETADGTVLNGIITRETRAALQVRVGAVDTPFVIATADVVDRQPSGTSVMPEGIVEGMAPEDLASLTAFLLGDAAAP